MGVVSDLVFCGGMAYKNHVDHLQKSMGFERCSRVILKIVGRTFLVSYFLFPMRHGFMMFLGARGTVMDCLVGIPLLHAYLFWTHPHVNQDMATGAGCCPSTVIIY